MNMTDVMTLVDYNYWATVRVLRAAEHVNRDQFVATPSGQTTSLREVLVHIMSAERLWRVRWETGASPDMVWAETFPELAALRQYWEEEQHAMRAYLATLDDALLGQHVQFQRASGDQSASFVRWHLLMQLVTHGTHHRSEAAALLTTYGQSPGNLDFLFFVLEQDEA